MKLFIFWPLSLFALQAVVADPSKPKPSFRGSASSGDATKKPKPDTITFLDDGSSGEGSKPIKPKPKPPSLWGDGDESDTGNDYNINIVGGTDVESPTDYPYYVYWGIGCGASLIAPNVVLTAAHCDNNDVGFVRVGAFNLDNSNQQGIRVNISRKVKHPSYNSNSLVNDFLLLFLEESITSVPVVPINGNGNSPADGELLTVIGTGATSEGGSTSAQLKEVDVPVVPHNTCNNNYGGGIVESVMFCAGVPEGGVDSCQGDSGGPIVTQGGVQVGVVSWGSGCARPNLPGVYARISGVFDWIVGEVCPSAAPFCGGVSPTPSPVQSPTPAPGCSRGSFSLVLQTDSWGEETTWEIKEFQGSNQVLASGGPYADEQTFSETACLSDTSKCYVLTMNDSYGDGINSGDGYVAKYDGAIFASVPSGSDAWSQKTHQFGNCGGNGPSPTNAPTPNPTPGPTPNPTPNPTPGPTEAPQSSPTAPPQSSPTQAPAGSCQDDPTWYAVISGRQRYCDWVAARPQYRCNRLGVDGRLSSEGCPEACSTPCPSTPTPAPGCSRGSFSLDLETDSWGEETTWEIKEFQGSNQVLASGGPYADEQTFSETSCLSDTSKCYVLTMNDSYGDGINSGNGYVAKYDGAIFASVPSGSDAWSQKTHQFGNCGGNGPSPTNAPTPNPTPGPTPNPTPGPTPNPTPGPTPNSTPSPTETACSDLTVELTTDDSPKETSFYLYQDGTDVWPNKGYGFSANNQYTEQQTCLDPNSCWRFMIFDDASNGVEGSGVTLKIDGSTVYSGGNFGQKYEYQLGNC